MRGRSKIKKPVLTLDSRYGDPLVTKLINKLMWGGKKETAERLVYNALEKLAKEQNLDAPTVLRKVIDKASPILEVRSRRVGGATYQVPVEVNANRKMILVMRWLLNTCRNQSGKPMDELLYHEMKNILEDTGTVMKKREDLHKMAESNRAFAHFARY
jgi:small subunit ribosomal protein S7